MVARALGKYSVKNTNKTKNISEVLSDPCPFTLRNSFLGLRFYFMLRASWLLQALKFRRKSSEVKEVLLWKAMLLGMCTRPRSNSTEGSKCSLNPRIVDVCQEVYFSLGEMGGLQDHGHTLARLLLP